MLLRKKSVAAMIVNDCTHESIHRLAPAAHPRGAAYVCPALSYTAPAAPPRARRGTRPPPPTRPGTASVAAAGWRQTCARLRHRGSGGAAAASASRSK